jgi:ParB-like chromosome segregation protein Spo0J
MNDPTIITLPVLDIKPYWRNPRENHEAVQKVKQSIAAYGYNQLIGVDKKHVIIAGHTRYLALRELGWTQIPVQVLDLTERQARAYRIIDNKTAEFAKWDSDLLLAELKELTSDELPTLQGFFLEEMKPLLPPASGNGNGTSLAPLGAGSDVYRNSEKEIACPYCGESMYISG